MEVLSQEMLSEVKSESEKLKQLCSELIARIESFLNEWKNATEYEFNIAEYDDVVLFELETYSCRNRKEYIIARNRSCVYLRTYDIPNYEYEQKELSELNIERIRQIAESIYNAVREHIEFLRNKNQEYEKLLQVFEKFKVEEVEEVKA